MQCSGGEGRLICYNCDCEIICKRIDNLLQILKCKEFSLYGRLGKGSNIESLSSREKHKNKEVIKWERDMQYGQEL